MVDKGGRPLTKIDWDEFDKLCALQCTQVEIAEWFGCTDDTIQTAVKREKGVGFSEYYKRKSAKGRVSLRRAQYLVATDIRNPTMLIWLGKQYLGQKEPRNIDGGAAFEDQPVPEIVIEEIDASLNDEGE